MKSRLFNVATFFLLLLQINATTRRRQRPRPWQTQYVMPKSRTDQRTDQRLPPVICGKRLPAQSIDHWLWHAAIYYVGIPRQESATTKAEQREYKCSGTLVDTNSILTAAHCVSRENQPLNAENVVVSLGELNFSEISSSEFLKTKNIILHPNYTDVGLRNDIAIIKLSTHVTFDDHVQPICLWDSNKSELAEVVGKVGTVVGWGQTEAGSSPDALQQANMPVVDPIICLESDRPFFGLFISTKAFCAGFRNGSSSCIGDSSGAMTLEVNGTYYIRGIISLTKMTETGEISCDPNTYTLFTDVAQHSAWITEAKCEKRVFCSFYFHQTCQINLDITLAERKCKVSIENAFDNLYNDNVVKILEITGHVEALPDLADVFYKFKDISRLDISNVKLKFIERNRLFGARRIKMLFLTNNRIDEISPDTFDDLSELEILKLNANRLKVIHRDVFKELYKLAAVSLIFNDLESLPEGLFRNNHELEWAKMSSNKLKIIATDFRGLPELQMLDLQGNECIDDSYYNSCECIAEFQSKIWNQCTS